MNTWFIKPFPIKLVRERMTLEGERLGEFSRVQSAVLREKAAEGQVRKLPFNSFDL